MDDDLKRTILRTALRALQPVLGQRSVAFQTPIRGEIDISSGTLVSVGERLFVATASHSVGDIQQDMTVRFHLSRHHGLTVEGSIVAVGRRWHDDPDVGYLEIGGNGAADILREQACGLQQIEDHRAGGAPRPTILIGFPNEYVTPAPPGVESIAARLPTSLTYLTSPLEVEEWPRLSADSVHSDPNRDMFFAYPKDGGKDLLTGESLSRPAAKGMSGGGVWDVGFGDALYDGTEAARLVGLIVSWSRENDFIRAVQIRHWLRLLHDEYRDLRPLLDKAFPSLWDPQSSPIGAG